jgi:lycopene beta-cyclase
VTNSFDYIIAGGGMAGLSLGFYLNESILRDKKVLIIDRDSKQTNDHTWCFWEKRVSAFEEIIFQTWQSIWFHGTRDFSTSLSLGNYEYKMIRAIDFYEFVRVKLEANPNFEFLQADILEVENGTVETDKGGFSAKEFVFDSFTRKTYDNPKYQNLWQHFLGWVIETKEDVFDETRPTLFDFRVEQKDECRFIYILPFSKNKALIEFTVFSDNLLDENEYEVNLQKYFSDILKIEDYEILETEKGVIPMSDEPHEENPFPKVIRIGTSGGYVKPSTGYSFKRTQRNLQKIVNDLAKNQKPKTKNQNRKWKSYLDSILLNVLMTKKHSAADVFTYLFEKNDASKVLKFLDEETSFTEDLQIMQTVPLAPFSKAALQTAFKKMR